MEQKKVRGFGFRGWMLFVYQFLAYIAFVVFTNWPMNVLGSTISTSLGQNESFIATVYTVAMVIGIVIQLILSRNIGKFKSIKNLASVLGIISMVLAIVETLINPFTSPLAFTIVYFFECLIFTLWCTFLIGILIGQWFPRRKGTFMGLVTIAFPAANAIMSQWIGVVFTKGTLQAFLPYTIACLIGLIIGIIFVPDFPEQCGAFRDNDKNMTPEMAKQMMEAEIENRKTTVWTVKETFSSAGFWLITIPMGFLLMFSVGMMSQSTGIIGNYYDITSSSFTLIMLGVAAMACVGSYVLGLIDTKFGTRKAMIIACCFMVASGIIGMIKTPVCMIIGLIILGVFMGASSNYTVSGAVQYWRIEDFPSVFARVNPIANLMQAAAPMLIAMLLNNFGYTYDFLAALICGIISLVLLLIFKPSMVKKKDDKLREKAGKPLDDVLVGRK